MSTVLPAATRLSRSTTRTAGPSNRGSSTRTDPIVSTSSVPLTISTFAWRAATSDRSCTKATVTPSGSAVAGPEGAASGALAAQPASTRTSATAAETPIRRRTRYRRTSTRRAVKSSSATGSISTPSPGPVGTRTCPSSSTAGSVTMSRW